jgi:N-acetyl-gamma-glutamyl-phosphate reductase
VGRDLSVTATSITGYSGGGKKMIEEYQAAERAEQLDAPRPYGLKLSHKHVPEMMAYTGLTTKPVFMPIVGPFYKGLAVSVPLQLAQLKAGTDGAALVRAFEKHYEGERFVRVMPLGDRRSPSRIFLTCKAATTPTASTSSSLPTPRRRS